MKRLAGLIFAMLAWAQAPGAKLDVVPSLSELDSEKQGTKPPRVFDPIQGQFAWERMVRSAAPEINFDHPTRQQLASIQKNAAAGGYSFCKFAPLLAALKEGTYWLVAVAGIERIRPTSMKICAGFPDDSDGSFKADNFWGELAAEVPARLRAGSSGFVVHSQGAGPEQVSRGNDRIEAAFSKRGIKTDLTLAYIHDGRRIQAVLDAQARQRLESWYLFRQAGTVYAFTKWKGDDSACATFYAIFEIGDGITEVTLTGEECDV